MTPTSKYLYALLLSVLCASAVEAQFIKTFLPADSPYWWPLADDVTSEELRLHFSEERTRERYLQAVELGLQQPLNDRQLKYLAFFVDGEQTPKLHRLPSVLGVFFFSLASHPGTLDELRQSGFAEAEIDVLVELAASVQAEGRPIYRAHEEMTDLFERLRILAAHHFSNAEFATVFGTKDYPRLAEISDYSPRELEELFLAWDYEPRVDINTSVALLTRDLLSERGWNRLRRFLLERVAPDLEYLDLVFVIEPGL